MRNKENTNSDHLSGACPTELFLSNNAPKKQEKLFRLLTLKISENCLPSQGPGLRF